MEDLRKKIVTVIERVGATDMAAEIILTLVDHHHAEARRAHEREKKQRQRGLSRDTAGTVPGQEGDKTGTVYSGSSSDLISSPGSPDLSKPTELKRESDELQPAAARQVIALVTKPASAFTETLGWFCETWRAAYGVEYAPTSSDRNQLGRLIVKFTPEQRRQLRACFVNYLRDLSPFVAQEQRHSLTWFCTKGNGFNKYRTCAPVLSVKEARTVAAGEQWEAMQEAVDEA